MAALDWKRFLTDYSRELAFRTPLLDRAGVPEEASEQKWLGYPPATDAQIASAERSLHVVLPDDVRAFYRTTNGWRLCGHQIYDIKPVHELCWLSDGSPTIWTLCKVDMSPPVDDEEHEWWYDQGVKVRRSLMLSTRGDDSMLLFDPESDLPAHELRYGTWAAWNPAMEWTANSLAQFFEQSRETLMQMDEG
jgi:hypothetical protein